MSGPYRLGWEPSRLCWVLVHGRWEVAAITGYLPDGRQIHRQAARELLGPLVGPLEWLADGTARPAGTA
ncbi:hypothetical protein ACFZAR_05520 [Streptomyces sp. NPDC008222]|uniref:hypothetical protein n=1 Tax=Streptomyces sp. NPDC008222 TaxID=3364820 RepID=UPI0036E3D87D